MFKYVAIFAGGALAVRMRARNGLSEDPTPAADAEVEVPATAAAVPAPAPDSKVEAEIPAAADEKPADPAAETADVPAEAEATAEVHAAPTTDARPPLAEGPAPIAAGGEQEVNSAADTAAVSENEPASDEGPLGGLFGADDPSTAAADQASDAATQAAQMAEAPVPEEAANQKAVVGDAVAGAVDTNLQSISAQFDEMLKIVQGEHEQDAETMRAFQDMLNDLIGQVNAASGHWDQTADHLSHKLDDAVGHLNETQHSVASGLITALEDSKVWNNIQHTLLEIIGDNNFQNVFNADQNVVANIVRQIKAGHGAAPHILDSPRSATEAVADDLLGPHPNGDKNVKVEGGETEDTGDEFSEKALSGGAEVDNAVNVAEAESSTPLTDEQISNNELQGKIPKPAPADDEQQDKVANLDKKDSGETPDTSADAHEDLPTITKTYREITEEVPFDVAHPPVSSVPPVTPATLFRSAEEPQDVPQTPVAPVAHPPAPPVSPVASTKPTYGGPYHYGQYGSGNHDSHYGGSSQYDRPNVAADVDDDDWLGSSIVLLQTNFRFGTIDDDEL